MALLLKMLPGRHPASRRDWARCARRGRGAIASRSRAHLSFGLVPALQASRADASLALRDADRGRKRRTRGRARTRSRSSSAEIALTLVLLVSAGLLANSFIRLEHVDPGFQVEEVSIVTLPLPQAKYPDGKRQAAFYQRILETIRTGRRSSRRRSCSRIRSRGRAPAARSRWRGIRYPRTATNPGPRSPPCPRTTFGRLGFRSSRDGRSRRQDRDPAPATAIVNATFVRTYLDGVDPLGKRVRFGEKGEDWIAIVGVVGDRETSGLHELPTPLLYLPYHRFPLAFMSIAVRSTAGTGAVASLLREAVKSIDPDMPVDDISEMRDVLQGVGGRAAIPDIAHHGVRADGRRPRLGRRVRPDELLGRSSGRGRLASEWRSARGRGRSCCPCCARA